VVFTWRILIFVFFVRLLAVPLEDMVLEDASLYFGVYLLLKGD
jgi:hypothetical protein